MGGNIQAYFRTRLQDLLHNYNPILAKWNLEKNFRPNLKKL